MEDSILKIEADAATVNMGSKWRMPTIEDCAELFSYTNYEYAVIDEVEGGKFISKADPSKYIFLPFAGGAAEDSLESQGIEGIIWSSSVFSEAPWSAYCVFSVDDGFDETVGCRYNALSVRGVC